MECINICENSGETEKIENDKDKDIKIKENEKMWFDVLQIFYDYIDKINSILNDKDLMMTNITKNPNYKIYLNTLNQQISKDIEDLFEKMYAYTGIKKIISRVSEANKQASSKEFKPVLRKLLKGYGYLDTILTIAKRLLANNAINNLNKERNLIKKGICYHKLICDKCKNNNDDKILLFRCGHKMHKKCCINKNNLNMCDICYEQELNESISIINFENLMNNLSKDKNKINSKYNNLDDNGSQNSLINIKNNNKYKNGNKYNKLDKINEKCFQYVDLMDIDTNAIRKNKRK